MRWDLAGPTTSGRHRVYRASDGTGSQECVPQPRRSARWVRRWIIADDHFTKALQNALQQPAVLPRTGSQATLPAHEKNPVLQGFAAGCEVVHIGRVEDRGLEPGASISQSGHDPSKLQDRVDDL